MRIIVDGNTISRDPQRAAEEIAQGVRRACAPGPIHRFALFIDHLLYTIRDAVFGLPRQPFRG
jgi:hypothetical protein